MGKIYIPKDLFYYNNKGKSTILTVGHVQSGKTRHMIDNSIMALQADFDVVIILGGSNNLLNKQTDDRFTIEFKKYHYPVYDARTISIKRFNNKIIVICLKHEKSLERVLEIMKESSDKKYLIFDDESDYGSINTSKYGETKLFSIIREMHENLKEGVYVSVTATPYADLLSKDSFKFNDIVRLTPHDDYTGLKEFRQAKAYNVIDVMNKVIEDNTLLKIIIKHIKKIYDNNLKLSTLLVNTDISKIEHLKIGIKIKKILDILSLSKNIHFANFDFQMIQKIISCLQDIYILNGTSNEEFTQERNVIVVGGLLASRGFTFKHLITTIMINVPVNIISADTLYQRARWLGYRHNLEFQDVYLDRRTMNAFHEIEGLNDVIFNENLDMQSIKKNMLLLEFTEITFSGKVI